MVVTRDMIADTGYNQSSDVLAFAGVADFLRGESYELRGTRLGYDLVEEMPDVSVFMDNVYIDSYEVIRGPAAVFYPTAALGGIILKTTRKPMNIAQTSFSFSEDQWWLYRAELDSTGPLGKLGQKELHLWLGAWIEDRARKATMRRARAPGVRHLLFAICDHYEPLHGDVDFERGMARVDTWAKRSASFSRGSGRPRRRRWIPRCSRSFSPCGRRLRAR